MARMAAQARQTRLMKEAADADARLATAERLYREGDVRVACRLFVRVALSRPRNESTEKAKQRLTELAEEAKGRLDEIETRLAEKEHAASPGSSLLPGAPPTPEQLAGGWQSGVTEAFRAYDELIEQYGGVPATQRQLKAHVARQRRRAEFAAVLNEPEARALWESGREHEADDHQCCAYWVYRQASRLKPAPSALLAAGRLAEMEQDTQLVAAAESCRQMQQCHKTYNAAKMLIKTKPAKARELFAQIVRKTPQDSQLHRAARQHLREM